MRKTKKGIKTRTTDNTYMFYYSDSWIEKKIESYPISLQKFLMYTDWKSYDIEK